MKRPMPPPDLSAVRKAALVRAMMAVLAVPPVGGRSLMDMPDNKLGRWLWRVGRHLQRRT